MPRRFLAKQSRFEKMVELTVCGSQIDLFGNVGPTTRAALIDAVCHLIASGAPSTTAEGDWTVVEDREADR